MGKESESTKFEQLHEQLDALVQRHPTEKAAVRKIKKLVSDVRKEALDTVAYNIGNWGQRLKMTRARLSDISQTLFAEILGIHKSFICKAENDNRIGRTAKSALEKTTELSYERLCALSDDEFVDPLIKKLGSNEHILPYLPQIRQYVFNSVHVVIKEDRWTQGRLAFMFGTHQPLLSQWLRETDISKANPEMFKKVLTFIQVSPENLLKITEEEFLEILRNKLNRRLRK
jgi:DNA-binding XRE family transcriptional regulator